MSENLPSGSWHWAHILDLCGSDGGGRMLGPFAVGMRTEPQIPDLCWIIGIDRQALANLAITSLALEGAPDIT